MHEITTYNYLFPIFFRQSIFIQQSACGEHHLALDGVRTFIRYAFLTLSQSNVNFNISLIFLVANQ